MRRFLIGLAVFAIALYGYGAALKIDQAQAGWIWVYCAPKNRSIPYPHLAGTTRKCYNPGMYVKVWKPSLYSAQSQVCVDGKPKVTRNVGKNQATSSWVPRRACVKSGVG